MIGAISLTDSPHGCPSCRTGPTDGPDANCISCGPRGRSSAARRVFRSSAHPRKLARQRLFRERQPPRKCHSAGGLGYVVSVLRTENHFSRSAPHPGLIGTRCRHPIRFLSKTVQPAKNQWKMQDCTNSGGTKNRVKSNFRSAQSEGAVRDMSNIID